MTAGKSWPTLEDVPLVERALQVLAEQARGLRWQIALTAAIVAAIVWPYTPQLWVVGWLVCVLVVREARAVHVWRLAHRTELALAQRWRLTVLWNLILGFVNGSAALFMLLLDDTLAALLTMVLVSWGAGAVSTSSTVMPAFVGYAAWMFLPTALMWFVRGDWLGLGTGMLVLMFFGVQLRFARATETTFRESFLIRQENLALAEHLARERSEAALARDDALRANEAKSRFLAAASHDLRQPLQALALDSGELLRMASDDQQREMAAEMAVGVENLRSMLDGLLDVSNLDAGNVDSRERLVDLDRLLNGVTAMFRTPAMAKGLALTLRVEPNLRVRTDPELLRRVLVNLLDNAIKYTERGGIDIVAAVDEGPHGDRVRLSVVDSGVGIAPDDQQRVFDELVQLGNPERDRRRGHGLGLSIVRRLCALLGTELVLQSRLAEGSTFTLWLPLAADETADAVGDSAAERVAARDSKESAVHGLRVLMIDDDDGVRRAYERVLTQHGVRVVGVKALLQAEQAVRCARFDVALVDFRLGGSVDGFGVIDVLRAFQPSLAAVLCSADTSPRLAARARELGVLTLRKPVSRDELLAAITTAHAKRHNEKNDARIDRS